MFQRLLACIFVGLGLAWLGMWLEFNRAPHQVLTSFVDDRRYTDCYGWPHTMHFAENGRSQYYDFELPPQAFSWWEFDCVGWNVLTLVAGGLLLGLLWNGAHSLMHTRRLSLRQCLVGLVVLAGLMALDSNFSRHGQRLAAIEGLNWTYDGDPMYVNTLPEYLVEQLPYDYHRYQRNIIGWSLSYPPNRSIRETVTLPTTLRLPTHIRHRYLALHGDVPSNALPAPEADCLRYLVLTRTQSVANQAQLFATQRNLRALTLEYASLALTELPPGTLRKLESLVFESCKLTGEFAASDLFPQLGILSLARSEQVERVTQHLAHMPRLTHIDLEVESPLETPVERFFPALDTCPTLREVTLTLDSANIDRVFTWAERRPLECVTSHFNVHAELPSFSRARLRAAIQQSPAAVWVIWPIYARLDGPSLDQVRARLLECRAEGVPILFSRNLRLYHASPEWIVYDHFDLPTDSAPAALIFGEHPAVDRLAAKLKPYCDVERLTCDEAELILVPQPEL